MIFCRGSRRLLGAIFIFFLAFSCTCACIFFSFNMPLHHYDTHMVGLPQNLRKELVPFTQLVKVRRGKLVLALPNIRFS